MRQLASLRETFADFDAYIVDLWGVIHDGESLYPGVREMLLALRAEDKQIVFLSNAPRRALRAAARLAALGIGEALYDHAVTSGEAVFRHMSGQWSGGRRYYYIGPEKDAGLLDGLPYVLAGLAQCDFLLVTGFFDDGDPLSRYANTLKMAEALDRPMICANPDKIVVRRSGEVLPCAGQIAAAYQAMGGAVRWFGKPYREAFDLALARFSGMPKARVLMVGDALETDILGAWNAGLASALVTGGILSASLHRPGGGFQPEALRRLAEEAGVAPDFYLAGFGA